MKKNNGKRKISVSMASVCVAAMVLLALGACGQKGPLALPGQAAQPGAAASAADPGSGTR